MSSPPVQPVIPAISAVQSPPPAPIPSPPAPMVLSTPTQRHQPPITTHVAPTHAPAINHPVMKLAHFNGKEGEFFGWSRKFTIRAHLLRYDDILDGTYKVDHTNRADTDRQLLGYSDLLSAASDAVAFSIVSRSVTPELSMGCLRSAWVNLNNRFNPQSGASIIHLKRKFVNLSLSADQDPSIWLMESEQLKQAVDPDMSPKLFLTHLISHLPPSYGMTINLLEMRHFEGTLTLDMFRQLVSSTYDKMKMRKSSQSKSHGSVAFVAENSSSNTSSTTNQSSSSNKGRPKCTHCGRLGHLVDKCWRKDPSQIPTCGYCSKKGHNEDKCFKKKRQNKKSRLRA